MELRLRFLPRTADAIIDVKNGARLAWAFFFMSTAPRTVLMGHRLIALPSVDASATAGRLRPFDRKPPRSLGPVTPRPLT